MTLPKFIGEDIETIVFTLPNSMSPLDIIGDIEKYCHAPDSVIVLQSYFGNKYLCTICGNDAVKELRVDNKIVIGYKAHAYEFYENTIQRVVIEKVPVYIKASDVDSTLRQCGKVLFSDVEERSKGDIYYALIQLRNYVPENLTIKRHVLEVTCF